MYEQTVAADNGDVLHYLERAEFKPSEHIWHPVVASLQGQVSMHVSTITTDRVSGGTITRREVAARRACFDIRSSICSYVVRPRYLYLYASSYGALGLKLLVPTTEIMIDMKK